MARYQLWSYTFHPSTDGIIGSHLVAESDNRADLRYDPDDDQVWVVDTQYVPPPRTRAKVSLIKGECPF